LLDFERDVPLPAYREWWCLPGLQVLSTQLSERDAEIARLLALRQEREASLESVKKLEQVWDCVSCIMFWHLAAAYWLPLETTIVRFSCGSVNLRLVMQQLREASQTALELKESQIVNLKTELQRAESAVDEHNKKHHAREAELDRLRSDVRHPIPSHSMQRCIPCTRPAAWP
jgi:uncharacterized protein YhaN